MNSKEIRSKLQAGVTINQVCYDYNLTFKKLVTLMLKLGNENGTFSRTARTGQLYVHEKHGRFLVVKDHKSFGSYRSLEDAVKIRDWFLHERWDRRWVDRACKETGVERCKR